MLSGRTISITLFLLLLMMNGCTVFRYFDSSTDEEAKKFQTSKDELWNRTQVLENETKVQQKQLAERQAELDQMHKELAHWKNEVTQSHGQIKELSKTVEDLNSQLKIRRETAQPPLPPVKKEEVVEVKPVIIRVLAGDGKTSSARTLSKKLTSMGYTVAGTGRTKRPNYRVTTIYYKSGYQTVAMNLAKQLGKGVVCKPLTWRSDYNIVAVAGGKP